MNVSGVADLASFACPLGHFCPENGTETPQPCPKGRFRASPGADILASCELCTAGSICEGPGTIVPAPCHETGYCPTGSSSVLTCPFGWANDNTTILRTSVNDSCTICPTGSFGPDGVACLQCSNGSYTNADGLDSCIDCEAGYICQNGLRLLSPVGHYGANGVAIPCPMHSYSDAPAVRLNCLLSPPGYFIDELGVFNLSGFECPLAHFCPEPGTESPVPCPAGTLRDIPGAVNRSDCTPCPEGYYCEANATSVPKPCSSTGYCQEGSIMPKSCPDGYEANRSTLETERSSVAIACQICPPTTASSGGNDCQVCMNGTYTLVPGEDACHDCEDGYICVDGDRLSSPVGHYGRDGQAIPCPLFTFNPEEAVVSDCQLSPEGYFINQRGVFNLSQYACPLGHYCPSNGTSLPVPCPAGTLRVTPGAAFLADCDPCPEGFFCPQNGTLIPTPCSAIGFCPEGSARPLICPLGFGNLNTTASTLRTSINSSCSACDPSSYGPDGISCFTCIDGLYSPEHGAHACRSCEPGYVCKNGTRTLPIAGTFAVSGFASPCPLYTFNEGNAVMPVCHPSPPGYFIDEVGVTSLTGFECPLGHFCAENGTESPQSCPAGTMNALPQGDSLTACIPCPAGSFCGINGTVVPERCLAPFYCVQGTVEPQTCPRGYEAVNATLNRTSIGDSCMICPVSTHSSDGLRCLTCSNGTYTNVSGSSACISCEPGYVCEDGLKSLAPAGHYAMYGRAIACPRYSYNPTAGVVPVCPPTPPGYYVNTTGVVDLSRYACGLGSFCPAYASEAEVPCPAGTLRDTPGAALVQDCEACPAGFYCPRAGTITPFPCTNEGYCAGGATEPAGCPRGYRWDDLNAGSQRVSVETGCTICEPGTYGDGEQCLVCPEASICAQFGMEYPGECSIGHFCNNGSQVETPCPAGTFNNETSSHCKPCPAGTFSNEEGRSACKPCSASAFSAPESRICQCIGGHRVFQASDSTCVCEPGYVSFSSSQGLLIQMPADADGLEDCQPITYPRCAAGETLSASGLCTTSAEFCVEQCSLSYMGELDVRTGVCNCVGLPALDDVCNASCRSTTHHAIDQYDTLQIHGQSLEAFTDVHIVGAEVSCDDQPSCNVIGCSIDRDGVACGYNLDTSLPALSNMPGVNDPSTLVYQPILCLGRGDYVLFDVSGGQSLRYLKDSLLNSNPAFDYGAFRHLHHVALTQGDGPRVFSFRFTETGVYVFAPANNTSLQVVVSVHLTDQACPLPGLIVPTTSQALIALGSAKPERLLFEPDWALLVAVLCALFGAILLIFVVLQTIAWVSTPRARRHNKASSRTKRLRFDKALSISSAKHSRMEPRFADNVLNNKALDDLNAKMTTQKHILHDEFHALKNAYDDIRRMLRSGISTSAANADAAFAQSRLQSGLGRATNEVNTVQKDLLSLRQLLEDLQRLVGTPAKFAARAVTAMEEAADAQPLDQFRKSCKDVGYRCEQLVAAAKGAGASVVDLRDDADAMFVDLDGIETMEAVPEQAVAPLEELQTVCSHVLEEQLVEQEKFLVHQLDKSAYEQVLSGQVYQVLQLVERLLRSGLDPLTTHMEGLSKALAMVEHGLAAPSVTDKRETTGLEEQDEDEALEEDDLFDADQDEAFPLRRMSSRSFSERTLDLAQQDEEVRESLEHAEKLEDLRDLLHANESITEEDREALLVELERDHQALAEKLEAERHRAQEELKARMAERRIRARTTKLKRRSSVKELWKQQREEVENLQKAQDIERTQALQAIEEVAEKEEQLENAKIARSILAKQIDATDEHVIVEAVAKLDKRDIDAVQGQMDMLLEEELESEAEQIHVDKVRMDDEFARARAKQAKEHIPQTADAVHGVLKKLAEEEASEKQLVEADLMAKTKTTPHELKRKFVAQVAKVTKDLAAKNESKEAIASKVKALRAEHEEQVSALMESVKSHREKAYAKLAKRLHKKRKAALADVANELTEKEDVRKVEEALKIDQQAFERALEVELAKRNAADEERSLKLQEREAKVKQMEQEALVRIAAEKQGKDAEEEVRKLRSDNAAAIQQIRNQAEDRREQQRQALLAKRDKRKKEKEALLLQKQREQEQELIQRSVAKQIRLD